MSFRDGPLKDLKVPLTWAAAAAVALTLAGAAALMFGDSRRNTETDDYSPVRETVDRVSAPVGGVLSAPGRWIRDAGRGLGGYFGAVSENRRLRAELKAKADVEAQLAHQIDVNERYIAMLGLRTDPPVEMVTGRAVFDSRGPFANARLINIGSEAGIKAGNPVMNEHGVVGRIVGVSNGVSRVLLLTDVASQVPVMIDRTNARALLTGDGGSHPRMASLRTRDPPEAGDIVVTSGDGGLFPRGLPVGVIAKGVDGSWRVELAADRGAIDFVRVLKFENFAQLAEAERLAATVAPQQMGGVTPAASAPQAPPAVAQPAQPKAAPRAAPAAPPAPAAPATVEPEPSSPEAAQPPAEP